MLLLARPPPLWPLAAALLELSRRHTIPAAAGGRTFGTTPAPYVSHSSRGGDEDGAQSGGTSRPSAGRGGAAASAAALADLRYPSLWFPIARSSESCGWRHSCPRQLWEVLLPAVALCAWRSCSSDIPTSQHAPKPTPPPHHTPAKRRLIAHVGPTNSGKTHEALRALAAARSGIYLAPLRLLACEVAERLNASGVPCNLGEGSGSCRPWVLGGEGGVGKRPQPLLQGEHGTTNSHRIQTHANTCPVTGQEARSVATARHTAATVEMADVEMRWGVRRATRLLWLPCLVTPPTGHAAGGSLPQPPLVHVPARAYVTPLLLHPHQVAVIDEFQMVGDAVRGWSWTRAIMGLPAKEVRDLV
jgi:hypothetical protein